MRIGIFLNDCFDDLVPGSVQNCRFLLEFDHFRFQKLFKTQSKVLDNGKGSFFTQTIGNSPVRKLFFVQSKFSTNKSYSRTWQTKHY